MTTKREIEIIDKYIKENNVPTKDELAKRDSVTLEEINNAINYISTRRNIVLNEEYLLENARKIIDISFIQEHDVLRKSRIVDISISDKEKEKYVFNIKKPLSLSRKICISKDIIGYYLNNQTEYSLKEAVLFLNTNMDNLGRLMELYREIEFFKEYTQPYSLKINLTPELEQRITISEVGIDADCYKKEIDDCDYSALDDTYLGFDFRLNIPEEYDGMSNFRKEYFKRIIVPLADIKESQGRNIIKKYVKR